MALASVVRASEPPGAYPPLLAAPRDGPGPPRDFAAPPRAVPRPLPGPGLHMLHGTTTLAFKVSHGGWGGGLGGG